MNKEIVRIEPRALRPEAAAEFIGVSPGVLNRCREAGWIKPLLRGNRLTIYRVSALELLLNRIEREGLPGEPLQAEETVQGVASVEGGK